MSNTVGVAQDELTIEQKYVSMLYGHLDDLREHANERLSTALRETGGTPQARSERDSAITLQSDRLAQLRAVEHGLCFGRLDFADGKTTYVGRIGLFDDAHEPLLLDWRAPAARQFYLATAAAPEGVRRRRQIRTEDRRVVRLDDEVLDLAAARRDGARGDLTSEAALLAAMDAGRTGRMRDIVATIQAEQDRVIRADLGGVLVVQGGPGTGKTAVALHRAAYLLYTYREQLSRTGVLILGPNETFLKYISQVLPSLAETGVLLCTLGDLYPGVRARAAEPPAVAEVKGRAAMVDVLAAAVRDRQRLPEEAVEIELDHETVRLDRYACELARTRARRTGLPHNQARAVFVDGVLAALAQQVADRIGFDPFAFDPLGGDDAPGEENLLGAADVADIAADLRAEPAAQAVLEDLWPVLTPTRLLADLFGSDERLASAGTGVVEWELLRRGPGAAWTPADVPLLDEAAELLGPVPDSSAGAGAEAAERERIEYARGAMEILYGSRPHEQDDPDPEFLLAGDVLDASRFAERQALRDRRTAAQRAAADRTWAFGHVIVDEAQELSPMAWRLLMRRCPSRSMTLVGDVAQTGDLGGTSSWAAALEPYVSRRWRLAELTVNYRTPAEVMALAARVLADIDPALRPPRSVRTTGVAPWSARLVPGALASRVAAESAAVGDGRVGVIAPAALVADLRRALPGAGGGDEPDLERPVAVLTVRQAKGLEFDAVVVVDPAGILAESPRGRSDLYVALTRATQRLGLLCPGSPPPVLSHLGG